MLAQRAADERAASASEQEARIAASQSELSAAQQRLQLQQAQLAVRRAPPPACPWTCCGRRPFGSKATAHTSSCHASAANVISLVHVSWMWRLEARCGGHERCDLHAMCRTGGRRSRAWPRRPKMHARMWRHGWRA